MLTNIPGTTHTRHKDRTSPTTKWGKKKIGSMQRRHRESEDGKESL
jgi:hypothetical protein